MVSLPFAFALAGRSPPPASPVIGGGADLLELLPIAAALVEGEGAALRLVAANTLFRHAGLGAEDGRSRLIDELEPSLRAVLTGDAALHEVVWRAGDTVDGRHYRVRFARMSPDETTGRVLVTLLDQTVEIRTEHSLRREMSTDSLTGLPNRGGFSDLLEAIPAADRARYAVLAVDLDRFSRVNACLGGLAGDELLITVARRLKGALRARDILGRTGGDEFGILLALDEGPSDAHHAAKRIQSVLASPFRLSDYEIRVACSIGIAFGDEEVAAPEELIRHAQLAVKRSKLSGRPEAYHARQFDMLRERFGMETALRRAIDGGQLRLTFQPICDLATGRVASFEALARWTNEEGVEFSPDEFIPVAEESGLIVPLGRWVLQASLATLAQWDARAGGDCGVSVAVNLSAIQLQRDNVVPLVQASLARAGLAGDRLKLELTESALIADPDRIARVMEQLKSIGTSLAMDDFGTGYSNLAFLQKLPIDLLKIDRSFVTGMLADRDKLAIVRAVLSLSQALGKGTVAEGVETVELGQTLAALGCTYGQGYAFARPLDPDAAYAFAAARNA